MADELDTPEATRPAPRVTGAKLVPRWVRGNTNLFATLVAGVMLGLALFLIGWLAPVLAPMARGILATASAPVRPGVTGADVTAAYHSAFEKEPFVHVLPTGAWPQSKATVGSNAVHLQATLDERANRLVSIGALDNLTKGTAGGAVQSMNLALGIPEVTGLTAVGVAP